MESRLTHGTWAPHEIRTGDYSKPREEWEPVIEIRAGEIALARVTAAPPEITLEQARANALAMAAAPELLAVAWVIVRTPAIAAWLVANDPKAVAQLRAAIEKAEGASQPVQEA